METVNIKAIPQTMRKQLLYMILQFLRESNLTEACHEFERTYSLYFDMSYFKELIIKGAWDTLEHYLGGFTNYQSNDISKQLIFEISKQKFLEAVERGEHERSMVILHSKLSTILGFQHQLISRLDSLRSNHQLQRADVLRSREILMETLPQLVESDPSLNCKLELPQIGDGRLITFAMQSLMSQYSKCQCRIDPLSLLEDHQCPEQAVTPQPVDQVVGLGSLDLAVPKSVSSVRAATGHASSEVAPRQAPAEVAPRRGSAAVSPRQAPVEVALMQTSAEVAPRRRSTAVASRQAPVEVSPRCGSAAAANGQEAAPRRRSAAVANGQASTEVAPRQDPVEVAPRNGSSAGAHRRAFPGKSQTRASGSRHDQPGVTTGATTTPSLPLEGITAAPSPTVIRPVTSSAFQPVLMRSPLHQGSSSARNSVPKPAQKTVVRASIKPFHAAETSSVKASSHGSSLASRPKRTIPEARPQALPPPSPPLRVDHAASRTPSCQRQTPITTSGSTRPRRLIKASAKIAFQQSPSPLRIAQPQLSKALPISSSLPALQDTDEGESPARASRVQLPKKKRTLPEGNSRQTQLAIVPTSQPPPPPPMEEEARPNAEHAWDLNTPDESEEMAEVLLMLAESTAATPHQSEATHQITKSGYEAGPSNKRRS